MTHNNITINNFYFMKTIINSRKFQVFTFFLLFFCVSVSLSLYSQVDPVDDQDSEYYDGEECLDIIVVPCPGGYSTPCGGTKNNSYCTACNSRKCTSSSYRESYCVTTIIGSTGHYHCFAGYRKSGSGTCSN